MINATKPDEIYNLAAQSDVWVSFKVPDETNEINYHGVGRLVHEAVALNPKVRIYQESTSEMLGNTNPPQNETSPFLPVSPYGEAKLRAYEEYVKGYREKKGLFICSGFLFNHESPRRGEHFVTRKITISLAKIKLGLQDSFSLGGAAKACARRQRQKTDAPFLRFRKNFTGRTRCTICWGTAAKPGASWVGR